MKRSILRTGMALACAVSLASCGGGNTGTLYLAGSVTGINKDGLVLQNNGGSDLVVPANSTSFQFTDLVPSDSVYNVTIKSQPDNVTSCTVLYGTGNTGLYSVSTVQVNCIIHTFALGGTVTGLNAGASLVLVNGTNKVTVTGTGADVPFQMAPVSQDYPFGVTVFTQPAGQVCTVTSGGNGNITGDFSNGVRIACANTPVTTGT